MKKDSKTVFWQALVFTIIVFVIGIFLGISYEGRQVTQINDYYVSSEIFLMDAFALSKISDVNGNSVNCDLIIEKNIEFADKIYGEAFVLEKYEESGKLSEELKIAHKKYDLLRTLLWINLMNLPDRCKENVFTVVYLYEYDTEDLVKKATNKVWEKILFDFKQEVGNQIILIPIAVDSGLASLEYLTSKYGVPEYPVVIIDDKLVSEIGSVDDLREYLN